MDRRSDTVQILPEESTNGPTNRTFEGSPSSDSYGYEELLKGTVPCPTCDGTGRIAKDKEHQLVALIPMSDDRLKPRRTTLYVLLAIATCLVVGGLLLFFMFPRSISLEVHSNDIDPVYEYINATENYLFMTIRNGYNVSNSNYYGISVSALQVSVRFDEKILADTTNKTVLNIPMRSMKEHYIEFNVTFQKDEGYIAQYCSQKFLPNGHSILLPFQAALSFSYLGHSEETTLTTYQHVRCSGTT